MVKFAVTIFLALASTAMAFPANHEGGVRVARGIFDAGFNGGISTHIGHYPNHGPYTDGLYPGGFNGGYPGGYNGGFPGSYNGGYNGGYDGYQGYPNQGYPNQAFGGPGFGGPGFGGPGFGGFGGSNSHADASASSSGGFGGSGSNAQASAGSYSG